MNSPVVGKLAPIKLLFGSFIFLIGLVFLFFIVSKVSAAPQSSTSDQNGRLLTIHDRGVDSVVLTDAGTVGEALARAGVVLDDKDAVEPGRDEQLVASEYEVNIYRARPVLVIDGATKQKVITPYQIPEQIATSVGITLYPEDKATITRADDILSSGAGLVMTIDRATEVKLNLYGDVVLVRTQTETVGEMLTDKGIKLGKNDRVIPSLSTNITEGINIKVWREGKHTVTVSEKVPFDTEIVYDGNREAGYREINENGSNGKKRVTYEVTIKNGKESERREIASITTKQPVNQIEVIGVKVTVSQNYSSERVAIMDVAGVLKSDQSYAAFIIDHENATWCPTRWQGQNNCPSNYIPLYSEDANIGYGLCQATPGNKMVSAGSDWKTNVITQMKWCASYAKGRYGSWQAAYNSKITNGWW